MHVGEFTHADLPLLVTGFIGPSDPITSLGLVCYGLRSDANQVGGVLGALTLPMDQTPSLR